MDVYTDYDFSDAVCAESDLDWRTREMLESICAAVENVAIDFAADASMVADFNV